MAKKVELVNDLPSTPNMQIRVLQLFSDKWRRRPRTYSAVHGFGEATPAFNHQKNEGALISPSCPSSP